jgi:hypothetical protein
MKHARGIIFGVAPVLALTTPGSNITLAPSAVTANRTPHFTIVAGPCASGRPPLAISGAGIVATLRILRQQRSTVNDGTPMTPWVSIEMRMNCTLRALPIRVCRDLSVTGPRGVTSLIAERVARY